MGAVGGGLVPPNGFKPKTLATRMGVVELHVPQVCEGKNPAL
jgi:hypothetical protein